MAKRTRQYQDIIAELYPNAPKGKDGHAMATYNITFQVTDECNLRCDYCYQINKSTHVMSMDVAKRFIDMILDDNDNTAEYIDSKNSKAAILEFIGGEPLLQIDLIDDIITYFTEQTILRNHPWQYHYMISICSNGVLYFDPKWQAFMKKHWHHLSFNISIDGNKELHDSCRVFPDGSGSYDIAMAGVRHFVDVLGGNMGSKMTLAPSNIMYTADAVKSLIESGYQEINLNCVFEKGWTEEYATILYYQLKELADYIIDNDIDVYISMFEQNMFHPKDREDRQNWCWGAGTPILTKDGYKPIEEIRIGDTVLTEHGTWNTVIDTMSHVANNCVKLNGLVCTEDHKIYVKSKLGEYGPSEVRQLISSDQIRTYKNGEFGWIDARDLSFEIIDEPQTVYNITVDTNHSYIAGGIVSANCGGNGQMISVDWKGDIYPCIRYMESSLGSDVPPLIIGNVYDGILACPEHKECARCLRAVDRITQSTEECIDCAIAEGCAWCSAYNFQDSGGNVNHRATYICVMHQARALGNAYYWNKLFRKNNEMKRMKIWLEDEKALKIIPQEELDMLKELEWPIGADS